MLLQPKKLGRERNYDYSEIYAWIVLFKVKNDGLSPTLQQIADGNGLKSVSHVNYILNQLVRAGLIIQTQNGIKLPLGFYQVNSSGLEMVKSYVDGHAAQLMTHVRNGDTVATEIVRAYGDGAEMGFDDQTIDKLVKLIAEYNVKTSTPARD